MLFNKSLDPKDYNNLREPVLEFNRLLDTVPALYNHQHRRWEYGQCLKAIEQFEDIDSVLDVGGGGALSAPMLFRRGYDVTVIDPDPNAIHLVLQQNVKLLTQIKALNYDFVKWETPLRYDAVVALSVIEHVPQHNIFFNKMFELANKLVFFTTDFSLSGDTFSPDHLRTYTKGHLMEMAERLPEGWKLYGDHDWSWHGNHVFNYSFVSFCAVRE